LFVCVGWCRVKGRGTRDIYVILFIRWVSWEREWNTHLIIDIIEVVFVVVVVVVVAFKQKRANIYKKKEREKRKKRERDDSLITVCLLNAQLIIADIQKHTHTHKKRDTFIFMINTQGDKSKKNWNEPFLLLLCVCVCVFGRGYWLGWFILFLGGVFVVVVVVRVQDHHRLLKVH
jgi:Flp pilus assembly protein TadB